MVYHEVMIKNKKKKGINVTVSPKAHEVMSKESFHAKPRRTLREHINIINKLPANI